MIERVVRMTFDPVKTEDFLKLFKSTKDKISTFPGCQHLELWQDPKHQNIFMTYSKWDTEDHLNAYRTSPLFEEVWTRTKAMFSDKPVAFSGRAVEP